MTAAASTFDGTENPLSEGGVWDSGPGASDATLKSGGLAEPATQGANDCCARYNTGAWGNDQSSSITFNAINTDGYGAAATRINSATDCDAYVAYYSPAWGNTRLYRFDDTGTLASTQLGANMTGTFTTGDVLKLTSTGTNHEVFKNGVSLGSRTDATYAAGNPGFFLYGQYNATDVSITAWDAADSGVAAALAGAATGMVMAAGTLIAPPRPDIEEPWIDYFNHAWIETYLEEQNLTLYGGPAAQLISAAITSGFNTGALTASIDVVAAAIIVTSAGGTLITSIQNSGAASSGVGAQGDLLTGIRFGGEAIAQALAAAGLLVNPLFGGEGGGSGGGAADLTIQIRFDGASIASAVAQADFSTGGANALVGEAGSSARANADLTTAIQLLGAIVSVVSAEGDVLTQLPISAAGAAVTSAIGSLDTVITMSAQALAHAAGQGDFLVQAAFGGEAIARALASGALSGGMYRLPPPARRVRVRAEQRRVTL